MATALRMSPSLLRSLNRRTDEDLFSALGVLSTQEQIDRGGSKTIRRSAIKRRVGRPSRSNGAQDNGNAKTAVDEAIKLARREQARGARQKLGERIFRAWNKELRSLCCGSGTNSKQRNALVKALTGEGGGAAVVAGLLVTWFGLTVPIAAIIAALLVNRIGKPAMAELCKSWKGGLR